jgi:hypothetical protein
MEQLSGDVMDELSDKSSKKDMTRIEVEAPILESSKSVSIDKQVKSSTSRRGRPPGKKESMEKSRESKEEVDSVLSPIENISKSFKQVKILNPDASFQKLSTKEETSEMIVKDKNTISISLPVQEEIRQTITDFLHTVDFGTGNPSSKKETFDTVEEELEGITRGIAIMKVDKNDKMKPSRLPKMKIIDDEIDTLTDKISVLETKQNKKKKIGASMSKKSIQDIIFDISPRNKLSDSQNEDSQNSLTRRIGGIKIDSKPSSVVPSRVSSERKTKSNSDIVKILKTVDKDKISGNRGSKYYSAKDMTDFLVQVGVNSSGKKKEEIAQQLLTLLQNYQI